MLKTTKRLKAVAQLLPRAATIADIGCDHGLLCAYLIREKLCDRVIAVDISPYSVEKTKKLADSMGFSDKIHVRLGNGFEAVRPGEADAAVLAGLGGDLIAQLIEKAKPDIPMVLQPMQQSEILREHLKNGGYKVTGEAMIEENGRIHELMLVEKGTYTLPRGVPEKLTYEVGPMLFERREPLLAKRLEIKADAIERKAQNTKTSQQARDKLMEHVELLRETALLIKGGE